MPLQTVLYQECSTHGRRRWQGDFVCTACGRVYQSSHERRPHYVRETCKCGVRLMPDVTAEEARAKTDAQLQVLADQSPLGERKVAWSARPICYLCFRGVVKHYNGVAEFSPKIQPLDPAADPVPDTPTE